MESEILLNEIEPELTKRQWEEWLAEESTPKGIRRRFGKDEEAITFWPDDYYDQLERWWAVPSNRLLDPIVVKKDAFGIIRIKDGWHRVAISHRLGLTTVPVKSL